MRRRGTRERGAVGGRGRQVPFEVARRPGASAAFQLAEVGRYGIASSHEAVEPRRVPSRVIASRVTLLPRSAASRRVAAERWASVAAARASVAVSRGTPVARPRPGSDM